MADPDSNGGSNSGSGSGSSSKNNLAIPIPSHQSEGGVSTDSEAVLTPDLTNTPPLDPSPNEHAIDTPTMGATTPKSSRLSRNPSFSGSGGSFHDDWEALPPLDRLTVLDILDNFALPQQLEKLQKELQKGISAQTEKVRKSREAINTKSRQARERMVDEWRRRVPSAEEQLERYRKRMRTSVEKLGHRWNDTKSITLREKISFIFGVINIFMSGYLIGAWPEYFHLWYTAQVLYFMPIRGYTYKRRGYHYFLADLCYFVNFLLLLSIWIFPASKRLFTAVYCLAFGNNAVAIIMWRNSLVFHSFDKVTSLFIHIMPCATLHCIVHLIDDAGKRTRFPAIWTIQNSPAGSPAAGYASVTSMLAWSTIPYAIWQLSYYFFITVRRREKIAAGRPTSFTWLRKSYSKVWIGRIVLSLPDALQEPAFMLIQYTYAVLTMLPCTLWFYSRWASAAFLMVVFVWSVYNGSTYYIDVFGKRFQKELEAMKAEVAKWQHEHEMLQHGMDDGQESSAEGSSLGKGRPAQSGLNDAISGKSLVDQQDGGSEFGGSSSAAENVPMLSDGRPASVLVRSGADVEGGARDVARERRAGGNANGEDD